MLILLPPSEAKTRPSAGTRVDFTSLSLPELNNQREQLFRTLIKLCSGNPERAAEWLGLGPQQRDEIAHNAELATAPTRRADEIYTGVLFGELGFGSLDTQARQRASGTVAIASALFGLVSPADRIPAYRLSGSASLPRLGTVASRWKPHLPKAIAKLAAGRLVVDLRSSTYVSLGKAPAQTPTATVRVLQERDGKRSIVSHFNKATKGRVVRAILTEGVDATTTKELASALDDLGWVVELEKDRIDLVVTET